MHHKRQKGQANQAYRLRRDAGRHSRLDANGASVSINRGDTFHPTQAELKSFGDKFEMVAAADNQPTFNEEDAQAERETTTKKAQERDNPTLADERKRLDPVILGDEGGSKPRPDHVDAAREVNFGGREDYKGALGVEKLDADDEVDEELDELSNDASGTEDEDDEEDFDDEESEEEESEEESEDDGTLTAGDFTSDTAHKAWVDAGEPKLGKPSGKGKKYTVKDVEAAAE